jgi:hypothetical protein
MVSLSESNYQHDKDGVTHDEVLVLQQACMQAHVHAAGTTRILPACSGGSEHDVDDTRTRLTS